MFVQALHLHLEVELEHIDMTQFYTVWVIVWTNKQCDLKKNLIFLKW